MAYRSPLLGRFPRTVTSGSATISPITVTEDDSRWTTISHTPGLDFVPAGQYVRLVVGGHTVMSDTRMERMTNSDFVRDANGDVLVAGLGIGMILDEIESRAAKRPRPIKSLTVVEKNPDVIRLVAPKFPGVAVIEADIFTWRPARGQKFDTIYFDIWTGICVDNLDEMAKLHRSFARFLNRDNPDAWMGSWMRDYLRAERRRDARMYA